MMIKKYVTSRSNEVHQLIVAASKHFYVSKLGHLVYQKKSIASNLSNIKNYSKNMIITYALRDHFSGVVYCEFACAEKQQKIENFLYRAWSQKEGFEFCGMPDAMTIPQNVLELEPELLNKVKAYEISPFKVTSGFQGGVRDIRTIEDNIRWRLFYDNEKPFFDTLKYGNIEFCSRLNSNPDKRKSKIEKWINNIGKLIGPELNDEQLL